MQAKFYLNRKTKKKTKAGQISLCGVVRRSVMRDVDAIIFLRVATHD
jgi:hypothetical protein